MGTDKSLLAINGSPLIECIVRQVRPLFSQVVIAADSRDRFEFLGLPVVCDEQPGLGPMSGILAALSYCRTTWVLCIPCDTPTIPLHVIRELAAHASSDCLAVVPKSNGHLEPLFALYRRDVAQTIQRLLKAESRSLRGLIEAVDARIIPLDLTLPNLNTFDDYKSYLSQAESCSDPTL